MKRGCSFTVLVLFVIFAAALYYVFKTRGEDILTSANEKIKREIVRQITENLKQEIATTAKDSVKSSLSGLKEWIQQQGDKLDLSELKNISGKISDILNEKVVNSETVKKITEEIKNYEKSKKDGN